MWIYAAAQNFNSIGLAFGSVISFASYNKYNNQILHDTITVSSVNAITSLLVAVFTFATIGTIAYDQQETIEKVIADGKVATYSYEERYLSVQHVYSQVAIFKLLNA